MAIKRKAQQLVQKGDVNGAIAEYEKLFEGGDKDPYDFIVVADLLAKRGSMQEAVRRYRQAVDEYAKSELYKNAIAVCKKILRISKEDLAIHRTLGELYAKEGLYGDAQIHYLEFAEGSIRRQDHDAALDVLDEVLKLSADNFDLSEKYVEIALRADQPERGGRELLRRAERAKLTGRIDEAEAIRERVSTLAPSLLTSFPGAPGAAVPVPTGAPGAPAQPARPEAGLEPGVEEAVDRGLGFEPSSRAIERELATPVAPPSQREEVAAASGGPPSVREPEPELQSHEELARGYLQSGNKDLAAEEYWKASELAFFRGDMARARELLSALLGIEPTHEAALRRFVDIAARAGDGPAEARARFELGEVYLAHEEWELSRLEYLRCLELDPENDRARGRVQRLDALLNGRPEAGAPIDLDSLPDERPASSVRVRDEEQVPPSGDPLIDLEEIIDEFKAGVSERISGEDHESHYDLGMAYMEMGLYDEAIGEFQVASKGSPMEVKCLEMIALCFLEKNEPASAARELSRALELPGYGPEETISIRYNLAVANERLGNLDRALQHFEEVYLLNVDFLKVASKVKELKQRLARAEDRA
ncbi:MAG: tetratricopeptide repeat protein [Candidatus Eisenbacteria bacterium]|uniref:Tetratricopeptide repeat protein n=1 Tax=Eiseniibacteriota bacterium TaxID=2212470 RepID=A0A538TB61_UNCEI|nr:MAG: tetratricopeptide repeat protein [Candidatus Eisenbacteria bacterium]